MGLFDHVNFEMDCPKCGNRVRGFQTKDSECRMQTVEIDAVTTMYSSCECGQWIELTRASADMTEPTDRPAPASFDDAKKLGFRLVGSQEDLPPDPAPNDDLTPTHYSHAYTIAFELVSADKTGADVTAAMLLEALAFRLEGMLNNMEDSEILEACGGPDDSFEMTATEAAEWRARRVTEEDSTEPTAQEKLDVIQSVLDGHYPIPGGQHERH